MGYLIVNSKAKFDEAASILEKLPDGHILSVDYETNGLAPKFDTAVGVGIAWDDGYSMYIPSWCEEQDSLGFSFQDVGETFVRALKRFRIICHKWVFDSSFAYTNWGVAWPIWDDTYLLARLANEPLDMKDAMRQIFHLRDVDCADIKDLLKYHFGAQFKSKGFNAYNLPVVHVDEQGHDWGVGYYCAKDADYTRQYYFMLKPKIVQMGCSSLHKLEVNLLPIVRKMNLLGAPVNVDKFKIAGEQMLVDLGKLEEEVYRLAGHRFKIRSPKECPQVLFNELKLPVVKRSHKTGAPSTDKDVMEELMGLHPIIEPMAEWKNTSMLYKKSIEKLPEQVDESGRIYTEFNSLAAVSGRFTSSSQEDHTGVNRGDNLQNQPKKRFTWVEDGEERGASVREAFEAPPGWVWVRSDYSQVEPRVQANLSQDPYLLNNLRKGIDPHTTTAALYFNKTEDEIAFDTSSGGSLRKKGKIVYLALSYGMGIPHLARSTHMSEAEAEASLNAYWDRVPGLKAMVEACKKRLIETHMIKTFFGRVRYINVKKLKHYDRQAYDSALRKAFNTTIQGTAAEIMKIGMLRVAEAIKPFGSDVQLILTVHDELDFIVKEDVLQEALPVIIRAFEVPAPADWVPFTGDISYGPNWDEVFHTKYEERDPEPFTSWKNVIPACYKAHIEPEFMNAA